MNLKEANEAYKILHREVIGKHTDVRIVEALDALRWSLEQIEKLSKELVLERSRAEHGEIFVNGISTQLELYNRFTPKREGE